MTNTNLENNKISEIVSIFYKFMHIASGLDYGFITFRSRKIKCIVNSFLVIIAVAISVACLIYTYIDETWIMFLRHSLYIIQHLLYMCFFMSMNREATLSGCLSVFRYVDIKLHVDIGSYNLEIKHLSAAFVSLVKRIIMACVICVVYYRCLTGFGKNIFFFWLSVCRDVIVVQNVFVFYVIKCRLAKFIYHLKLDNLDIISYHRLYKMISDIAFKLKRAYDSVFTTTLLFNVTNTMTFIYYGIAQMKDTDMTVWEICLGAEHLVIVDFLISTFSPALLAGMLSSQAEHVIHMLHDKLLECRDKYKARGIKKFIHYVEAHPLKFTAFKVIPLDASLPGMVLGFCITYIIVIIQFAHLF